MAKNSPIEHWSYSAMSQLMRNPLAFKKQYILKVYDNVSSPSSVVGSAGHKALEEYYKGKDIGDATKEGLRYINNISDTGINYGKQGTRQKIIDTYTKAINWYLEEVPRYHRILGVEYAMTAAIQMVNGGELPLPGKAKLDLITENKLKEIEIIDHKFVKNYSDGSIDVFSHFLQAMFAYHLVKQEFGRAPARMIFNECKTTLNSKENAGKPQLQPYTIEFDGSSIYGDFATFYSLYNACTQFVTRDDAIYLPNPSDIFDGQASFEAFRMGIIGVEQAIEVKHKLEQKAYVEKNYVPSAFDKAGNEAFTPEARIEAKLTEFGIGVDMQQTLVGPSVIKYRFKPNRGVPMGKIAKLGDDLAIALEAKSIRIEAPIRGTSLVGIEVANPNRKTIELGERHFLPNTMKVPIGVDVNGNTVHKDLSDMPHLLIAGQTGSGKSVMLNVLLTALTKQMPTSRLKLILIDPKQVELAQFEDLPHLLYPIEHEQNGAVKLVEKVVALMEQRYAMLTKSKVRSIDDYNKLQDIKKMPKIAFVIDEFADLMLAGGNQKRTIKVKIGENSKGTPIFRTDKLPSIEELIVRIAQKARAVGIHLVLATQRPSADVVTGLIKANVPTKIAFAVTNKVNSQVILDQLGAEELTGKGDMLFQGVGESELLRLQGLYC